MKIIIDNNILFSLIKPDSTASKIFENKSIKFIAPEFIKSELDNHSLECMKKSGLSENQFNLRRKEVESRITFYDVTFYKALLKKALKMISDPDDSPYLALALAIKCPIWSNDAHLKEQLPVDVLTTKDLIYLL